MKNRILFTLMLTVFTFQLFACSCMPVAMGVNKIMESGAMVRGKIISKSIVKFDEAKDVAVTKEEQQGYGPSGYFKYTLEIQERIKGIENESTIHFYSNTNGAACGLNYAEGTELYVFLYHSKGKRWFSNSCSGNISKERASEEQKNIIKKFKTSNSKQEWFNEYKELEAIGEIKNQKACGKWKTYFADGTIASEGKYKKGKKNGQWKFYRKPAKQTGNSNKEKTEPVLEYIEYYKKGEKINTETVEGNQTK